MSLLVYWGGISNHQLIGALSQHQGKLSFTYESDYVAMPQAIPVSLALPLSEKSYQNKEVLNWLSNLLPDDANVRERVQRSLHLSGNDVFSILSEIGKDCIGAWQFIPEGEAFPTQQKPLLLDETSLFSLLKRLPQQPLGMNDESTFRLSISGTQEKTGLIRNEHNQWLLPQGNQPSTYIIKPSMGVVGQYDMKNSVLNEHVCLSLCKEMGWAVTESEPITVNGLQALAVKRFDRIVGADKQIIRRPQEDMCQVFSHSPSQKYQSDGGVGIYEITQKLKASKQAELFFEQQVFFWLIGAIDNHAKNTSIFLNPQGRFQLTPLYDVISVAPLAANSELHIKKIKMAMSFAGKYEVTWINHERILQEAKKCGLSTTRMAKKLETLPQRCLSALERVDKKVPHASTITDSIKCYVVDRVKQLIF